MIDYSLDEEESYSEETRKYYYQGGQVLYTEDETDALTSMNILGLDDNFIATSRQDAGSEKWYLYNKDIRESTSSIASDTGDVVKSYLYDEFGNTQVRIGESFDNEICYTGQIYDEVMGLYYYNARYYNPEDGRFITQDTYRGESNDPLTYHLYAYCANNPINYVDPSGHVFRRTYTRNQCRNMYYQLCGIEKTISLIFAVKSLTKVTIKGIKKLIKNKKKLRKVI